MSHPSINVNQIKEMISLCQACKIPPKNNLLTPFNEVDNYKLEFKNPLKRGQLLEEVIRKKIAKRNLQITLHGTRGTYFERNEEIYYQVELGNNLIEHVFLGDFANKPEFETKRFRLKQNKHFKASQRCLAKISIDYCFIDLVIDDTIIDIKTDVNQKSLNKHIRQLFVQAILYESFLRSKIRFRIRNFPITDGDKSMICSAINNIAIYFWRSNHFFKYAIEQIVKKDIFDRMAEIYSFARGSERPELRSIMKMHLFKQNSV